MTTTTTDTPFITDLGRSVEARGGDGSLMKIGRYGVWVTGPRDSKPRVVDASDDLEALMARYRVPAERVVKIESGRKMQEKEG